jgi:hypothetical protein
MASTNFQMQKKFVHPNITQSHASSSINFELKIYEIKIISSNLIFFIPLLREDVKKEKKKKLLAIDDDNDKMSPIPPHCNLNYATKLGFILGRHVVGVLFISRSKFKIDAVTVYIYMMLTKDEALIRRDLKLIRCNFILFILKSKF